MCRRIVLLAALLAAGCGTIRDARRAQEDVAAQGDGRAVSSVRVDLRGYSLAQLVGFAMTNRPSVVAARLAVDDARLALKEIAADAPLVSDTPWTAPNLSLSGAYAETSPGTHWRDHDYATKGGTPSAALSLEVLVWDFGRYGARARAQATRVVAAEQSLAEIGYTVFDEVTSAYFTHLARCAHLEVALTNAFEYAEFLRRAEARLTAGEAHKLDVLKARLDLATANETVVAASNLVATTGAELMNALGVDASRGTYEDVLDRPPAGLSRVVQGFAGTHFGVGEAYARGRTNAPAVRVARAQLRAASGDVDYAVADLLPKVSATASFSWADPLWYWSWGASAAQSLFQGFRKTTAVDRAVVALKSAAASVDAAEQQLSLDLEVALANRDNSVKAIETAVASIRSARENLDMVRRQFEVGSVSRIELSEAIASLSSALGSGISAYYTGQAAEAKLFRLTGGYPVYAERTVGVESL